MNQKQGWGLMLLLTLLLGCCAVLGASLPESTLSACELLKIKEGEWSDVKRGMRESTLLMKAMEELKLSKLDDLSESSIAEENRLALDNLKEYERLDKILNIHVSGLQLLCKKDSTSGSSSSTSSTTSGNTNTNSVKTVQSMQTSSVASPIETVKFVETKPSAESDQSTKGDLSEREMIVNEPGLSIVNGAIIAGTGLKSCIEYKTKAKTVLKSGKYWINTGTEKFIVYCDMSARSGDSVGGWMLISSRSSKYEPIVVDNVITPKSFKGETMNNARFQALLKSNTKMIMLVNGNDKTAFVEIAQVKTANCVPFGKDISKRVLFHIEKDCNLLGNDYCTIGVDRPGGSAEVYNYCGRAFRAPFNFNNKEINKELDIYIK